MTFSRIVKQWQKAINQFIVIASWQPYWSRIKKLLFWIFRSFFRIIIKLNNLWIFFHVIMQENLSLPLLRHTITLFLDQSWDFSIHQKLVLSFRKKIKFDCDDAVLMCWTNSKIIFRYFFRILCLEHVIRSSLIFILLYLCGYLRLCEFSRSEILSIKLKFLFCCYFAHLVSTKKEHC